MSTSRKQLENELNRYRKATSAKISEEHRIAKEFRDLLIWLKDNLPSSINLPQECFITRGRFTATLGRDDDKIDIDLMHPENFLNGTEVWALVYLANSLFLKELCEKIRYERIKEEQKAENLRKVVVPASL